MPATKKISSFFRNLYSRHHVDSDLDSELQAHLQLLIDENLRSGMSPTEAQRAARLELGGLEHVKDQVRDQQLGNWLRSLLHDLLYGLRRLRAHPGPAAVMIFTLALAIGASTAIFSVVYGVLLRPLPYSQPDRLAAVFEINSGGAWSSLADPNFDDFRSQSRSFQYFAKYRNYTASVSGAAQPTRTDVAIVSPEFLSVFAVQPLFGRDFTTADSTKGAAPTVLLSYGYWKQYLGASTDLSQAHLKIDGSVYSVIGVLPQSFRFPATAEFWLPAGLDGENRSRTAHNYKAVARLRDGATFTQANQEISAIARRIHSSSAEQSDYLLKDATVLPLQDSLTRQARSPLLILLGSVAFLLLVACANVANLLLAQASVRERELAIRSALGAARARLVRQFLTESFLLSFLGGSFGVLGAIVGVSALLALAPPNLPRLGDVSINLPVLAFSVLLTAAVAAALGTFTALRATGGNPQNNLAQGGRGQSGSPASQRLGRTLVAAQIAITLVLVVGAGLLARSLFNVLEVHPGFRTSNIVTMDVSLPSADNPSAKSAQSAFYSRLLDRLKQIPGVQKAGATSGLPMDGGLPDGMFLLMTQNEIPKSMDGFEALFQQKERLGNADFCVATREYFEALAIPLVRGRLFDNRDSADAPHVAVISESLARDRWPNQDPLGHTIEFGNMDGDLRLLTIVGIVGDTHEYGLDVPARPTVFANLLQRPRSAVTIALLSDSSTSLVTTAARAILHDLDPEAPARFRTFSQVYSASLGSRKFNLLLVAFFGAAALLLATTGVFGVMAYSVSQRTREIGVRLALGARPREILKMVLTQGLRTIFLGIAIGLAAALALTRTVASLLFGVTVTDPLTFAAVTALLIAAALAACYLPARRATQVDPLAALRYD